MEGDMLKVLQVVGVLSIIASILLTFMKFYFKTDIKTTSLVLIFIITAVVVMLGYTNILKK